MNVSYIDLSLEFVYLTLKVVLKYKLKVTFENDYFDRKMRKVDKKIFDT